MKKVAVVAAIFAVAYVAARRFAPTFARRAMEKCQEMIQGRSEERAIDEEREQLASSIAR
jgi:predicted metal-dependent hydrolase